MKAILKKRLITALVAISMGLSSFSAVGGLATGATTSGGLGHFSFAYGSGSNDIYDLNYTSDNYSFVMADSVSVSGEHIHKPMIGYNYINKTIQLANVTLYSSDDEDMLLMAATNSTSVADPAITMKLPSQASVVSVGGQHKNPLSSNGNGFMQDFLSNTVYRMPVQGGFVYYMSNAPSSLGNNGKTIVFQNDSFLEGNSLLVGVTPSASIKYSIYSQLGNNSCLGLDPLIYDQSTGKAYGNYVSLYFDNSSGVLSDFKNIGAGTDIFSEIYSYGDGSIGGSPVAPSFPSNDPTIIGNMLYYANHTAVYEIQNTISAMANFFVSNGTLVLKVSSQLSINAMNGQQNSMGSGHGYMQGRSITSFSNFAYGNQYMIQASSKALVISNGAFMGELLVQNGMVLVSGNTITVSSPGVSHVTFVSPNWMMQSSPGLRNSFQYAEKVGKLGGFISVGSSDPALKNLTTLYDPNMQMVVESANGGNVRIQIGSALQGERNVAIFVPDSVIKGSVPVNVLFDGKRVSSTGDVNAVFNSTDQEEAICYSTAVSGGMLYVIHVPHFSTHTVAISQESGNGYGNVGLYVAVILLIGLAVASAYILRTRSKRAGK